MTGSPWTAPPGAPSDLNPPSALPEWAMVMGGSWGARPPYCSGAPPCAATKLGPRAAPARWCGLARRPRPPREPAAGGAGARGVQVQPHPPPPRIADPSGGGGASPRLQRGGGSLLWPSNWGGGAGGGGWGAAPPPPTPTPRRASACHLLSPACPPGVYSFRGGCRAAAGVGRGPVGRQWVSAAGGGGGGGGNPPTLVRAPVFPRPASEGAAPFAPSWAPAVRRRSAAGRAGACGRFTGGACRGCSAPSPRMQRPLRGGCGAAVSSVCLRPLLSLRGRWGGVGGALWSPGAAP